ncbi:hypothetical protein RND71_043365 [Anisodus tanguticus]|uniref:Pre-mRNA-splicing factor 38 n=1 Tax=Anisodus tanguticus TaxID=243964 RepID=A0AAE1UNE0_9SOLA|nr:hypothetical protein RND71_043365 [Anisodus tanguticus]
MANRTAKEAKTIHGTNPQYLIEKIVRTRIYDSKFWKEECFALNMEYLVDKACELRYVGGTYGDIWKKLEPLYNDFRKLRCLDRQGKFYIMTVDEFIDNLLREDRFLDVILPRISKRILHEEVGDLEPKVFIIDEEANEDDYSDDEIRKEISDYKNEKKKKKEVKNNSDDEVKSKPKTEEDEIEQANELRKKLGLKPLKR